MTKKNNWLPVLQIEVVQGGFILTYPKLENSNDSDEEMNLYKEVFVSPRKMIQKVKEVIDNVSTVAADDDK